MLTFFTGNEYHTDKNAPRFIGDKLLFNSRLYFIGGFVNVLFKARKKAMAGLYDREEWAKSSYDVMKLVEGCGGKFHVTGIENISSLNEPVVFVSNHMSTLETVVFPAIIAPFLDVIFVVKESLTRHPIFGPINNARRPIKVTRKNPRDDLQTVMREGESRLSEGTSVIIFPQSTRTTNFIPEDFNSLGIKLAKRSNVKVVPIAVKTDFWQNGNFSFLKDLGPINRNLPIHICFGQPLSIEGNGKEEHKLIVDFIASMLKAWDVNS